MNSSQDHTYLSTKPYRGTRDFFPEIQRVRNSLFNNWKQVLTRFGFEEYDAPLLEPLELYAAKSSEEIVSTQLYSFLDRAERKVALRPEMTPTLARMVASRLKQLPRPIRWFSIPRCMRYERPQRGRLREFDQLNVDIFGGTPFDEDLEILLICTQIMQQIGASPNSYEIRLNDRRLMNDFLMNGAGFSEKNVQAALSLIDKKDKIEPDSFQSAWSALHSPETQVAMSAEQFLSILASIEDQISFDALKQHLSPFGQEALQSMMNLKKELLALVPGAKIDLDLSIARGFDYYTGMVFEIFDTHPENRRALFGGGRYDNLIGSFTNEKLAGVGFGVSDVSLLNFCEVHQIQTKSEPVTQIAVVRFENADRPVANHLAMSLRNAGLRCTVTLNDQKFGKQIQTAEKTGAKVVAFRGQEDLERETFTIKWLETGVQESLSLSSHSLAEFAARVQILTSQQ